MKNLLAKFLIIFGAMCLLYCWYLYWERTNPNRLSFDHVQAATLVTPHKNHFPKEIIIPDVHIDLPIYPAHIYHGNWETTTSGVSYLVFSPIPGDTGNSIIYGHNWTNLFGPLVNVKPGEQVEVLYDDSSKKNFTIEFTQVVTPDDIHILDQSKDTRITMYTCTGLFDSHRFVAVAILNK